MNELTIDQKIELFKIAIEYSKVVDAMEHSLITPHESETLIAIRFLYLIDLFTGKTNLGSGYEKGDTPFSRFQESL